MSKESTLVVFEEKSVLSAFTDNNGLDETVNQAKTLVSEFDHDLSTAAGRARTASLANKVAKLKTRLDGMGKELVSEWKAKAKKVDINRKSMRDALDELKVEARKPLTDWEEEQEKIEAERLAKEAAEKLQAQIESDHELALLLHDKYLAEQAEIARKIEEEKHASEQKRLRQIEEQKQQAAAEAKAEAERAAAAERERLVKAEHESRERAKEMERARIAAEERAKIEAEQAENRRIDAEKRAKLEVERAAEQARQKQIAEQRAKEKSEADELARREANKEHVRSIRKDAKLSLMALNIDEETAKNIVIAIDRGDIKNVIIQY